MAAHILRRQLKEGRRARVLTSANSLNPSEGAEAFNRILSHDFPQVAVSVANLEARARTHSTESAYKDSTEFTQETKTPETPQHPRPEVESTYVPPAGHPGHGYIYLGPRYSVNSELERFSPRDPGEPLDGIGQYLYPSRFDTPVRPSIANLPLPPTVPGTGS